MTEQKREFRLARGLRRAAAMLVLVTLVAVICFGSGFLAGGKQSEPLPELSVVVVQNQLQQVSHLTTIEYHYTNMGQFEQHGEFYGVTLPFSTKRFLVSYDGAILAGIDLEQAKIGISDTALTVTLPEARIVSHEMDEQSLEVFDETRNIFNPITIEDYNGFLADQKDVMEAKAIENGLLSNADGQARLILQQLLEPLAQQYGLELLIR